MGDNHTVAPTHDAGAGNHMVDDGGPLQAGTGHHDERDEVRADVVHGPPLHQRLPASHVIPP